MNITTRLIATLCCGGLAFGIAGVTVSKVFPIPRRTLLLDRSYCSPDQWQAVVQDYTERYRQHQRKEVVIAEVVTFSRLGSQPLAQLPDPSEVEQMQTFGQSADAELEALLESYGEASAIVLSCE